MDYLESFRGELFLIADAKRGDIGNTSAQYAKTFFEKSSSGFDFDAVTVLLEQCGVSLDHLLTAQIEAFNWRSTIVHQED
jgi:orotidine-5'-phosphate decarboxylase